MGEMTIRLDDALMLALQDRAGRVGCDVEQVVLELIRYGLAKPGSDRSAVARAILARQPFHDVDSTAIIREERAPR